MFHVFLLIMTAALHQPETQHQWAELLTTSSERVDIDTASIQTIGPRARRVWLRWDLDLAAGATFGPGYEPQYELEHRDFDCAGHRTRVIEKRREVGARSTGSGESLSAHETS